MVKSTDLDDFRGMAGRRAAESRRERKAVAEDQAALRARRDDIEAHLFADKAADWAEAVEKARWLLMLLAKESADPRIRRMVAALLADFERLLGRPATGDG